MKKSKKSQIKLFLTEKYWVSKHKKNASLPMRLLSVVILTLINFSKDNGFDKAATLTFYSLLTIVPLLAIGFGIAQKLGWEEIFMQQIKTQLENQPDIADKIIQFAKAALKQTKGNIIAGFGILVLLWTVFKMIVNIEESFNEIWKVKSNRTLWQGIKRYIPLILLFPICLVAANGLILFVSAMSYWELTKVMGPFLIYMLRFLPFFLIALILTFAYILLPNKKVPWKAGLIAGITTAILYQLWQWIYIEFQIKSASYGAIYGSFAAIPLFLIWLNYSWLIVLFGTELSAQISKK